jgi:hypothetical protein
VKQESRELAMHVAFAACHVEAKHPMHDGRGRIELDQLSARFMDSKSYVVSLVRAPARSGIDAVVPLCLLSHLFEDDRIGRANALGQSVAIRATVVDLAAEMWVWVGWPVEVVFLFTAGAVRQGCGSDLLYPGFCG